MHLPLQLGVQALALLASLATVIAAPLSNEGNDGSISTDYLVELEERAPGKVLPPTKAAFQAFFRSKGVSKNLVFWTGFKDFKRDVEPWAAKQHGHTLEMVLGKQWEEFQLTKAEGGYWPDRNAAIKGFWDPCCQTFAEQAQGEALFLNSGAPYGPNCWERLEKPALIQAKKAGKLRSVTEWAWNSGKPVKKGVIV